MRTSDRDIFAVGECVEHRGKLYGLVDPIWEQAKTLADVITGFNPQAGYLGSKLGTKLKVMGVELASMGDTKPSLPDDEVVVYREPSRGVYKKLIVRDNKLAGAILLGETDTAGVLMQMFLGDTAVSSRRADLLFGKLDRRARVERVRSAGPRADLQLQRRQQGRDQRGHPDWEVSFRFQSWWLYQGGARLRILQRADCPAHRSLRR